jgi:starch synthase
MAPSIRSARAAARRRVLHVASEVYPWIKTGGLADVAAALPHAMAALPGEHPGLDVRLLVPGYRALLDAMVKPHLVAQFGPLFGAGMVRLFAGRLPDFGPRVYVIDAPSQYERAGDPYVGPDGQDWPDNLDRFALLSWVAAYLASGDLDPAWQADVLHAHDWHAALACAYLEALPDRRVSRVFTIHNLAFQGRFPLSRFGDLRLPPRFNSPNGLEFYGSLNCMKAGLMYAERLATVSPTYAREIQTTTFGNGMDGVLRSRADALSGILNGVDYDAWNPQGDPLLPADFSAERLDGKALCRRALREEFKLPADDGPVFGVVSRLTEQKGIDWVVQCAAHLAHHGAQLVVLGSGQRALEDALRQVEQAHPQHVAVHFAYDEAMAHRIYAGCDVMLVPSRFEPCGLTQMYALAYGALPLVRATGGLADTVIDAGRPAAPNEGGTGFAFVGEGATVLAECIDRAMLWWQRPAAWRGLQRRAMAVRFTWAAAAQHYLALYRSLP